MFAYLTNSLDYIIPFLIVLTVLVFIHELGHYLVARWNGVKVDVFSIGFGPELFGWTDRAQTRWKVSLIPLGGYVKMFGDADPSGQSVNPELITMSADLKSQTLTGKSPWQRIAVASAGPIANYLLAIVLFAGIFFVKGFPTPVETGEIGDVMKDSVAQSLGLLPKDKIVRINTVPINKFADIHDAIKDLAGKDIEVEIQRPLEEVPKTEGIPDKTSEHPAFQTMVFMGKMVTPSSDPRHPEGIIAKRLGLQAAVVLTPIGLGDSIANAVYSCYNMSVKMLDGLWKLITGQSGAHELGGILSIGEGAKQSSDRGISSLVMFMAMLSVNLGLVNLLPVPVLDGGHILLCTIEGVRGKPVSERVQEVVFMMGLTFVLGLMLYSTWNDLAHFKIIEWVTGLFG